MNDILKTSKNFLCELFLEYLMPIADVYQVLEQITLISNKIKNPLVDYIIGVNFHVHLDRRQCKCFLYLKFENEVVAKSSDFAIVFEELFIYLPESLPITNTVDIIFYIADFAVGAARKFDDPYWYWYEKFYTCTRMRLTYSDRIENFIFSEWREWTLYGAMVGRLVDVIDPETFPNMLFSDVLRYKKSDAIDYLIENEPLQYLRGSEDFDKKIKKVFLRSLGFKRRNYDFDSYFIPWSTERSLDYLKKWINYVECPKILVLVGTYCCPRTKVIINFVKTQLHFNIINILSVTSSSFLYEKNFLFLDFVYLELGSIDIKTDEGRTLKKSLVKKITDIIINKIYDVESNNHICDINNLSLFIKNNLVIYDIENDMVEFSRDSSSYNYIDDFFRLNVKKT